MYNINAHVYCYLLSLFYCLLSLLDVNYQCLTLIYLWQSESFETICSTSALTSRLAKLLKLKTYVYITFMRHFPHDIHNFKQRF